MVSAAGGVAYGFGGGGGCFVFLDTIVAPEDQDLNVGRFNMDEVSVQTAVQDAESVPFFGDRRLVMIDNPTFLTGEKEKKSIDHQLDRLQAYLENPMDSSVMVFFAPYEKLDQRKKIVKQLKKVAVLLDASELSERDVRQYIKDYLRSQQYGIQVEWNTFQFRQPLIYQVLSYKW